MSFIAKGAVLLGLALPVHAPAVHHIRPACAKTFTVFMAERGARSVYAGTRRVSEHDLRMLGWFEHCSRNPAKRGVVRAYDRRQRAAWLARIHPPAPTWAIPYPIVACESGGQNLPPNSAGASGYYQIIPSTWQGYGGSAYTSEAYLASKAHQDLIARRIWDQAGPSQWVCAGITGY